MFAVRASACSLPFPNEAFDLVICMDTLEHIPAPLRPLALREIVRVARIRAIIGFPSGKWAYTADRMLARAYRLLRLMTPDWLNEHQEFFPGIGDVKKALESVDGISIHFKWAEYLPLHFVIMLLEMHPRVLGFLQRSIGRHHREWLRTFHNLNLWPCYRLICIVDRSDANQPPAVTRRPLW